MRRAAASLLVLCALAPARLPAGTCPPSRPDGAKTRELVLYFPTAATAFPCLSYTDTAGMVHTVCDNADPFAIGDLDNDPLHPLGITENDLIDAIVDQVRDDYCEFDVRVVKTRMAPAAAAN